MMLTDQIKKMRMTALMGQTEMLKMTAQMSATATMVETMVMMEQMVFMEPLVKPISVSLAFSIQSTTCPPTLSSSASSTK